MRIFKTKWFTRWATKEGINDATLKMAVSEMQNGQIDADLGGHVYKKRLAKPSSGKSGGWRTLLAFRLEDKAFYIFGFAKNTKDNIDSKELKALRLLAKTLLNYNDDELKQALYARELIEVNDHE